jgi:formate dehydrogenase subunit delta
MSELTQDIIRMGNQIVDQFPHLPEEKKVEAVATHIHKFWERRMLGALYEHIDGGADDLDPVVIAAAAKIRSDD